MRAMSTDQPSWTSLGTCREELLLANTLPTGQSFRWRPTGPDTFTGVIGQRVVQLRQLESGDVEYRVIARGPGSQPSEDAAVMHDYFNLGTNLSALASGWCQADERFRKISRHIPGARMLRQDPVECLFQFICSSNNHISRIHGMVERLCSTYGSELLPSSQQQQHQPPPQTPQAAAPSVQQQQSSSAVASSFSPEAGLIQQQQQAMDFSMLPFSPAASAADGQASSAATPSTPPPPPAATAVDGVAGVAVKQQQQQLAFYAFPTLQQLSAATEEALRADGFGYRAKFIVGSVRQLLDKPEGGEAWLLNLRQKSYAEAHEALCSLPGIGPKVAACICLFSLDKHDAIPVDTHVWTLATRYYAPHLANKTLNKNLHDTIQQVFVKRFGAYAGWAHNTLFISELASHKQLLPAGLASPGRSSGSSKAGSSSSGGGSSNSKQQKQQQKKRGRNEVNGSKGDDGFGAAAAAAAGDGDGSSSGQEGQQRPGSGSAPTAADNTAAAAAAGKALKVSRRSSRTRRRTRRYHGSDVVEDFGSTSSGDE